MKTQEELHSFVRSKLKRGYPEGELRNELLQEGYTAEEIQKAIYDPPTDPAEIKKAERKKFDSNPLWYLGSIVFIILGLYKRSGDPYTNSHIYGTSLIVAGIIGLLLKLLLPLLEDSKKK
jgi:hypothetical protein